MPSLQCQIIPLYRWWRASYIHYLTTFHRNFLNKINIDFAVMRERSDQWRTMVQEGTKHIIMGFFVFLCECLLSTEGYFFFHQFSKYVRLLFHQRFFLWWFFEIYIRPLFLCLLLRFGFVKTRFRWIIVLSTFSWPINTPARSLHFSYRSIIERITATKSSLSAFEHRDTQIQTDF